MGGLVQKPVTVPLRKTGAAGAALANQKLHQFFREELSLAFALNLPSCPASTSHILTNHL